MITTPKISSHPIISVQTEREDGKKESSNKYAISQPEKVAYITNQKQPWAHDCLEEMKALDSLAAEEGLPPPDSNAKNLAEFVLDSIVKFPDPFPRPQIFVDDGKVIVLYFIWQCSFVSLNIWSDKIWCLSTINSERRECLCPPETKDNVIKYFFLELRRLMSKAKQEER